MELSRDKVKEIINDDWLLMDDCEGNKNCDVVKELARIALASLEAEAVAVTDDMAYAFHHALSDSSLGADDVEEIKAALRAAFASVTATPAPVSVPDDVSGPLAHAYKELTPTFMRNHIDVFERYGIYPDGSAGIQAMRIALDGMNRRAAMLQGADGTLTNEGTIPVTQFKPVADLYGLTSPTGGETSFTFDAVEARDFIDGGWSCQEYVELERFQEAITNHTEDKLAMVDHSGDSNNMVEPVTTAYKLPPHIFRELVNRLRDTAVKYQGCQQLREQLSRTLQEVIQPAAPQQEA